MLSFPRCGAHNPLDQPRLLELRDVALNLPRAQPEPLAECLPAGIGLPRFVPPVIRQLHQDGELRRIEAEAALKEARAAGSSGRISKEMIDSAAAVFIAERYLAAQGF